MWFFLNHMLIIMCGLYACNVEIACIADIFLWCGHSEHKTCLSILSNRTYVLLDSDTTFWYLCWESHKSIAWYIELKICKTMYFIIPSLALLFCQGSVGTKTVSSLMSNQTVWPFCTWFWVWLRFAQQCTQDKWTLLEICLVICDGLRSPPLLPNTNQLSKLTKLFQHGSIRLYTGT